MLIIFADMRGPRSSVAGSTCWQMRSGAVYNVAVHVLSSALVHLLHRCITCLRTQRARMRPGSCPHPTSLTPLLLPVCPAPCCRCRPAGSMKACTPAALLLLLGACAVAHGFPSKGAEFSPSVVLTNLGEMGAPCHQMVQNAINTGAKSIKFVPTVHYWGSEKHIDKFCIRWGGCVLTAAPPGLQLQ